MTIKGTDLNIYGVLLHALTESKKARIEATTAYNKHTALIRKHRPLFSKAY